MRAYKLTRVLPVPDDDVGRTFNAVIENPPFGVWCAEWMPEAEDAWPLTDENGDYVLAPVVIKDGVVFVNMTPHAVTIPDVMSVPPSGIVARAECTATSAGDIAGIPIVETSFLAPDLPEPAKDVIYIVSTLVVNALPCPRSDVVAPDTGPDSVVRDKDGHIIGVQRFQRSECKNEK